MGIIKNYLYNMIYQVVILILPLITVPYVSRVLGSKGVGINAFTFSVISYFILFGTLGIGLYGNRSVAYVRDDRQELSKTFWGIIVLQIITTSISFCLFLVFLLLNKRFEVIFLIQSIFIIAAAIDVSWLFMGLEDFKKTVTRNLFVRLAGVVAIFVFVKDQSDLWKYILILALSQLLGQITMWFYLPKTVDWVKIHKKDIVNHLVPTINLFLPQIAIQVYTVLNKTMLGVLSTQNEVGYFENADKMIKIILAVVTALGIVMLPRISNVYAQGDMDKVKIYLYKSFNFVSYLSFPAAFGIAGVANHFAPWFFGSQFEKTGLLITIMSPIIVLIAWSGVTGTQFLMPIKRVHTVTISVCVGAVVNFILNLVLIGKWHSTGTAISTLAAESSVTLYQLICIRKLIDLRRMIKPIWKYFIASGIMCIVVLLVDNIFSKGYQTTLFQIIVGAITYLTILFVFHDDMNSVIFKTIYIKITEKIKFLKHHD
ncbi:MAG: flippase [Sporolactobacillus sp.]